MKKIVALVVVLIALLLGAYYGTGVLTERNLKKNIGALQDANKLKVRIVSYQRGFFTSNAILNVEVLIPAKVIHQNGKKIFKPSHTYFSRVPMSIYHGPIIFGGFAPKFGLGYATSSIDITGNFRDKFDKLYTKSSTRPELNLNIFVNLAARTELKITTPKFSMVATDKESSFAWHGMTSQIDLSRDLHEIDGSVSINGLKWIQDKTTTVLNEVNSYFKLYKGDFDLYLGDSGVHLPSALVTQGETKLIEVKNLDLKSNSAISKKLFSSSLQAKLDKIFIDKETYKNCSLDVYVRNLDAETLISINKKLKRSQNGSERQQKQAIVSIVPDLPVLLNKGAEIEISDLNVNLEDGGIRGNIIVSLPNDNNTNPFYLIQKARGSGHIEVSKQLLRKILHDMYLHSGSSAKELAANVQTNVSDKNGVAEKSSSTESASSEEQQVTDPNKLADIRADNKLSAMLNSGVIVADGSDYITDIKIVQGRIIVNDKPFSSDMLRL